MKVFLTAKLYIALLVATVAMLMKWDSVAYTFGMKGQELLQEKSSLS